SSCSRKPSIRELPTSRRLLSSGSPAEGADTEDERRIVGLSAPDALAAEPTGLVLLCECDSADCRETVTLSQAALEAFRRTNRPVLAPGHSLGRTQEARRSAAASIEDAQALRAQATHQLQRARKVRAARVLAIDDSEIFLSVAASVVGATTELRL